MLKEDLKEARGGHAEDPENSVRTLKEVMAASQRARNRADLASHLSPTP